MVGSTRPPAATSAALPPAAASLPGARGVARRPLEDRARQRIAYVLIALLALLIIALLAGVVFGVILVSEIKEFGVILGPLVALVSAATGFYYGTQAVADSGIRSNPSRPCGAVSRFRRRQIADGTATAGAEHEPASGTLTFSPPFRHGRHDALSRV